MDITTHNKTELKALGRELKLQAALIVGLLLLMIVGTLAFPLFRAWAPPHWVGITPRTVSGLPAIFYAHFVHTGVLHLIINSVFVVVLGWLVMLRDTRDFIAVTGISIVVGGGAVWLLGDGAVTRMGSGALIVGYLGCLLSWMFFEKNILATLVSVGVLVLFGWLALDVLMMSHNISIGATAALISGFIVGRFMSRHFKSHLTRSTTDPL